MIMSDSAASISPISESSVSVVIVNHNAGEALALCLESALSQSREVVLVDNASDPVVFDAVVRRFEANPFLKIIRLPRNVGFAVACNTGAAASSAAAFLFLNPDCVAPPDLFKKMHRALNADCRIGMVGALLLNPDGTEQGGGRRALPTPWKSFVRAFGLWRFLRSHDFHMESKKAPIRSIEVDAISGACMMVRREAFQEVGGFDEEFFLHCEDLDLCKRFQDHEWKILFSPSAIVLHGKGVCSRSRPVFVECHKHRGMLRFYSKHFRAKYPAILHALVCAAVCMRFLLVSIKVTMRQSPRFKTTVPIRDPDHNPPVRSMSGVGVLGASSFVGRELLRLMSRNGTKALAFSRNPSRFGGSADLFRELSVGSVLASAPIVNWVSLCPVHALVGLLPLLELAGVRRLVAVSSTSKFTKVDSCNASDRRLAERLDAAEQHIQAWGEERGVSVFILRTTMIYDGIHDANVAAIAGFVRRFRWYPILAPASGLRQPIHACDVASACLSALNLDLPSADYNISGGETVTYRAMVERIFESLDLSPCLVSVPPVLLRVAVPFLSLIHRFRHLSFSMFQRMNEDMAFDHSAAVRDIDFRPAGFILRALPTGTVDFKG